MVGRLGLRIRSTLLRLLPGPYYYSAPYSTYYAPSYYASNYYAAPYTTYYTPPTYYSATPYVSYYAPYYRNYAPPLVTYRYPRRAFYGAWYW